MKILVTAASRYGSTEEIGRTIGEVLRARGFDVTAVAPDDVGLLSEFDGVVLGSAVYVGHWLAPAIGLADRIARELPGRPVWLFSSGPVGDPTRKLTQQMGVDPVDLPALRRATGALEHRMFAGKLDRHNLKVIKRVGLSMFRSLQGDFRNWQEIRSWAESIADAISASAVA